MRRNRNLVLVARRELQLMRRNRAARVGFVVLLAVAWLPPLLVPLRAGTLGLGAFPEMAPLMLALSGAVLPLLALLAGTDVMVGELEDGSLVPVLTLAISRGTCVFGKYLARAGLLTAAYVVAFGSAGAAICVVTGRAGLGDYLAVSVAGWLLTLVCLGLGTLSGTTRSGRVRAFGMAIAMWLLLVFVLDAILLAAIVALAPPPPEEIGMHGHAELTLPHARRTGVDPHAHHAESEPAVRPVPSAWLMLLNPVDLFRLNALGAGPGLRTRLRLALPATQPAALWLPVAAGWVLWAGAPLGAALWRFRRLSLM